MLGRWAAAGLVTLVACGGDDTIPAVVAEDAAPGFLADVACDASFDCDCPGAPWRNRNECDDTERQRVDDMRQIAQDNGLTYDGVCVSEIVTRARTLECIPALTTESSCEGMCKPYFGTNARGEACEPLGVTVSIDACGQGLTCEENVCVPLCDPAPVLRPGAACMAGIEVLGVCEVGSYCDDATATCEVAPALGEACPDQICTRTAFCDLSDSMNPTCAERLPGGAGCTFHDECLSSSCDDLKCATPLAAVCATP